LFFKSLRNTSTPAEDAPTVSNFRGKSERLTTVVVTFTSPPGVT
jgi:hypothetical protein